MVFTQAQNTAFFETEEQMGIPHATVVRLRDEGITSVHDLSEFYKDGLAAIANNLRRPAGRVADPDPGAEAGATIPTPPFVFGARSQARLLVICELVRYYEATNRALTPGNVAWGTVGKNFEIQWKALVAKKDKDPPEVPKISRSLPILKWVEVFEDYLSRVVGDRTIPLTYVIREEVDVPAAAPDLANGKPHSTEHGSVEMELVARASHDHPLYRTDNQKVYEFVEEATRTTSYSASIKPFMRSKDGRGAYKALVAQYAGTDKWEALVKTANSVLHTHKWKGQNAFTLEQFVAKHRNAFVTLQNASRHITIQLPNGYSRVGYLLDGIENSDAELQASMAAVKQDHEIRTDFEKCATKIVPSCPVAKKRAAQGGRKRGPGEISETTATEAQVSSTEASPIKHGKGPKTGVSLRFHHAKEYRALTKEQKLELKEWREKQGDSNPRKKAKKSERWNKKQVATLVAQQVEAKLKEAKEDSETAATAAQLMSLLSVSAPPKPPTPPQPTPAPTAASIQAILKKAAKNNGTQG